MKKLISFFIVLVFLISCDTLKEDKMRVGVILPLTGSASVWGQNALMGLELASQKLENEGTAIELLVEDSKSQTANAVSALEKLISQNKVQIVIGDIASSSVLAMAPIAEKNKIILLSPGASNPDITEAGDYVFRNWQSDALEGTIDAEFVYNTLNIRNVAILNVNNGYGTGLKDSFEKRFLELGGTITINEVFEQDTKDVKTQLLSIKNSNSNYIYMPGYPKEMATVLKQAKEVNLNIPFLSTQAFDDPFILSNVGNAANGVIYSVPRPPDTSNAIVNNFKTSYRNKYNKEPGVCSDTGYDALRILVEGYKKGARTGTEFKDYLYSVKNFEGAAGLTAFDSNGDVIRDFIFKIIENNMVAYYE